MPVSGCRVVVIVEGERRVANRSIVDGGYCRDCRIDVEIYGRYLMYFGDDVVDDV